MSTPTTAPTLTGEYTLDAAHTRIGFVARHAMVTKVRGSFNQFEGRGYFDAAEPANSNLRVTIRAASIDTRSADRDGGFRGSACGRLSTTTAIQQSFGGFFLSRAVGRSVASIQELSWAGAPVLTASAIRTSSSRIA